MPVGTFSGTLYFPSSLFARPPSRLPPPQCASRAGNTESSIVRVDGAEAGSLSQSPVPRERFLNLLNNLTRSIMLYAEALYFHPDLPILPVPSTSALRFPV